jgi:hypothetical protein
MDLYLYKQYKSVFIARVIISLILILYTNTINNFNAIHIFILILFIDYIDGLYIKFFINKNIYQSLSIKEYQYPDKIVDVIIYLFVLIFFRNIFTDNTYLFLWILLLYRIIGVYYFINYSETKYLHYFVDGINITILIYGLSKIIPYISNNYELFVILGILIKIAFEYILHNKKSY